MERETGTDREGPIATMDLLEALDAMVEIEGLDGEAEWPELGGRTFLRLSSTERRRGAMADALARLRDSGAVRVVGKRRADDPLLVVSADHLLSIGDDTAKTTWRVDLLRPTRQEDLAATSEALMLEAAAITARPASRMEGPEASEAQRRAIVGDPAIRAALDLCEVASWSTAVLAVGSEEGSVGLKAVRAPVSRIDQLMGRDRGRDSRTDTLHRVLEVVAQGMRLTAWRRSKPEWRSGVWDDHWERTGRTVPVKPPGRPGDGAGRDAAGRVRTAVAAAAVLRPRFEAAGAPAGILDVLVAESMAMAALSSDDPRVREAAKWPPQDARIDREGMEAAGRWTLGQVLSHLASSDGGADADGGECTLRTTSDDAPEWHPGEGARRGIHTVDAVRAADAAEWSAWRVSRGLQAHWGIVGWAAFLDEALAGIAAHGRIAYAGGAEAGRFACSDFHCSWEEVVRMGRKGLRLTVSGRCRSDADDAVPAIPPGASPDASFAPGFDAGRLRTAVADVVRLCRPACIGAFGGSRPASVEVTIDYAGAGADAVVDLRAQGEYRYGLVADGSLGFLVDAVLKAARPEGRRLERAIRNGRLGGEDVVEGELPRFRFAPMRDGFDVDFEQPGREPPRGDRKAHAAWREGRARDEAAAKEAGVRLLAVAGLVEPGSRDRWIETIEAISAS